MCDLGASRQRRAAARPLKTAAMGFAAVVSRLDVFWSVPRTTPPPALDAPGPHPLQDQDLRTLLEIKPPEQQAIASALRVQVPRVAGVALRGTARRERAFV